MTSTARSALAVLTALVLALPGRAQDAQDAPEADTEAAPQTAEVPAEGAPEPEPEPEAAEPVEGEGEQPAAEGEGGPVLVEEEEGSVLDDQTFEGEDDDFIPTEQIPVDEPIPFPTDI
jgi:hypothetical protein